MSEDKVDWLGSPGMISDSLTELLRQGARGLIEKAVEAKLQVLLDGAASRRKNIVVRES